jgi:hypothetical protein
MNTTFKCYGTPLEFPLPVDGDWVRIQCGVDGKPNYIFGISGLKLFYEDGAGIYSRDSQGKPENSFEYWEEWYLKERDERIKVTATIQDIKQIIHQNPTKFKL